LIINKQGTTVIYLRWGFLGSLRRLKIYLRHMAFLQS